MREKPLVKGIENIMKDAAHPHPANKRSLLILQQLLRGPKNKRALINEVNLRLPDAYAQIDDKARDRVFERDLARLRQQMGIEIRWDPGARCYALADAGAFTPELPENVLTSIAFLLETFDSSSGAYEIIAPLLQHLKNSLSSDQLRRLQRHASPLRLELRRLDESEIHPDVWEKVRFAIRQRRVIEFFYQSPRHEEQEPRQHRVEPYELNFERGHYYVRGYCLRWKNPAGMSGGGHTISYRLDYISAIELLKKGFTVGQRRKRLIPIRYRLAPRLWRGGVSRHFEDMNTSEPDAAGWVTVDAKTDDLFQARRVLLAYGPLCQAIAPPELVQEITRAVQEMQGLYNLE